MILKIFAYSAFFKARCFAKLQSSLCHHRLKRLAIFFLNDERLLSLDVYGLCKPDRDTSQK